MLITGEWSQVGEIQMGRKIHCLMNILFLKTYFIYFFMRHRERGRDTDRGRSRLPTRSSMPDSIPDTRITP